MNETDFRVATYKEVYFFTILQNLQAREQMLPPEAAQCYDHKSNGEAP